MYVMLKNFHLSWRGSYDAEEGFYPLELGMAVFYLLIELKTSAVEFHKTTNKAHTFNELLLVYWYEGHLESNAHSSI